MSAQVLIAVLLGLAATAEDLWRRNISNWIPLSALLAGFLWHVSQQGWSGVLTAAVGAGAGFLIFLVFYLLGGMGGGDVKLMAGFGALLGLSRLIEAALWTAIIGAVLAALVIAASSLRRWVRKDAAQKPLAIPYAPAITAGVWLSLVPR
ncbi:MAG: prepilin peptidase [Bryobacterales bacterium]|nr:prepilin peptidase [Bryobacterales bacterium]